MSITPLATLPLFFQKPSSIVFSYITCTCWLYCHLVQQTVSCIASSVTNLLYFLSSKLSSDLDSSISLIISCLPHNRIYHNKRLLQYMTVKIPLCYTCESTQHSSVKYHLCQARLSRGFIFNYPLFSQRTISYTTRLPRPSTQLSNTITLNHFIHHSDSKAVHSVIQCHLLNHFINVSDLHLNISAI